jgi:hypothetical protein
MPIDIRVDPTQLDAAMRRLENVPYALQHAIIPALSQMMQQVRDQLAGYLRSEVPLPEKLARRAIRLSGVRVAGDGAVGEVTVRSAHIPLIEYDVSPGEITARLGMPSRRWPGFTYSLRAGERRRSEDYPHSAGKPFVARMPGGHLGVYYRPGYKAQGGRGLWGKGKRGIKSHAAIKQIYGPDVQYHVATPEMEQSVLDRARAEFPGILARCVDQALARHAAGEFVR